ncbi:hypothetical protein EBB07_25970 [Paenibacillaceae bacterium]|nr:hypothetical protein EBB07_25970 [Paenibacillaceae bacterium]
MFPLLAAVDPVSSASRASPADPAYSTGRAFPAVPAVPADPPIPADPGNPSTGRTVEKDCCGNLLIQGIQPAFQIWETDVEAITNVLQVTIYSSPSSTDTFEVEFDSADKRSMTVLPGNTTTFISQGINAVKVSSRGNALTYIEGKFAISATLTLRDPYPPANNK